MGSASYENRASWQCHGVALSVIPQARLRLRSEFVPGVSSAVRHMAALVHKWIHMTYARSAMP